MNGTLLKIPLGAAAELRVVNSTWRGRQAIHVRVYFLPHGADAFVATRQGVALRPEHLAQVIAALQAAQKAIGALGVTDDAQHHVRRRASRLDLAQVRKLTAEGKTPTEIATQLGVSRATLYRRLSSVTRDGHETNDETGSETVETDG